MASMTWGEAVKDPTTSIYQMARAAKLQRVQAIDALMAQGMTREQAWLAWMRA